MSLTPEEIESITLIQQSILNLTEESKPSVAEQISRSHYNDIDQVPYLFNFLCIASDIRPTRVELIADLCVLLKDMVPNFHQIAIRKLNKEVFIEPIKEGKPILHIELYFYLYKREFISFNVIHDMFNWIYDDYNESMGQIALFMCWFKFEPKVSELFREYVDSKVSVYRSKLHNCYFRCYDSAKSNPGWTFNSSKPTHRELVYHPYYNLYSLYMYNTIKEADILLLDIFLTDNVESLQELCSNNYDLNQKFDVGDIPMRAHPFLQYKPTLLNIAEFYGAIKCFKFLILNGALYKAPEPEFMNYRNDERKEFTDAFYAVAGGNLEIIRIIEQAGIPFVGCVPVAAYFHHNEVYSWLVETKGINNNFEDAYNAIGETNNIALYSQNQFNFPYIPFVASKKGNIEFIKLFAPTCELLKVPSNSNHSHVYYAMKHDFPHIVEYIGNLGFGSLYWATKKGYNELVKKILAQPNAQEIVKLDHAGFNVLDVAITKGNEELISIYQSMNISPKKHTSPAPSLFVKYYFARDKEFSKLKKIPYDPNDNYDIIYSKLNGVDTRAFSLNDHGRLQFRGKAVSKGVPIIKYNIHRGNIIEYQLIYTGRL